MGLNADFKVLIVMNFQAAHFLADLMKAKPHGVLTYLFFFLFYIEVLQVLTKNGNEFWPCQVREMSHKGCNRGQIPFKDSKAQL